MTNKFCSVCDSNYDVFDQRCPNCVQAFGIRSNRLRDECLTACIEEGEFQRLYNRVMNAIDEYDKAIKERRDEKA